MNIVEQNKTDSQPEIVGVKNQRPLACTLDMSPARAGESPTQSAGEVSTSSESGICSCSRTGTGVGGAATGSASGEILASAAATGSVPHPRILTSRPEMPTDESSSGRSSAASGTNLSIWERLIAGGMAGALSKTVIAPADRVKILYQVRELTSRCGV